MMDVCNNAGLAKICVIQTWLMSDFLGPIAFCDFFSILKGIITVCELAGLSNQTSFSRVDNNILFNIG